VANRQVLFVEGLQGRLFHVGADALDVIGELLAQQSIPNEVHLHALCVSEPADGAAEQNAVEAGKGSLNLISESRDKLLHGVPFKVRGLN
jgi:hypothetical protein